MTPLFESGVFVAKALEFSLQFLVGHGASYFSLSIVDKSTATNFSFKVIAMRL